MKTFIRKNVQPSESSADLVCLDMFRFWCKHSGTFHWLRGVTDETCAKNGEIISLLPPLHADQSE